MRNSLIEEVEGTFQLGFFFFYYFLGRGEAESTWYVGHYLAYCTSAGR
jgi:hypothetical protein